MLNRRKKNRDLGKSKIPTGFKCYICDSQTTGNLAVQTNAAAASVREGNPTKTTRGATEEARSKSIR